VPDKEDLNRIPLFSKLNEEEIRRCIDSSDELFIQPGEEFITEGKPADYFYVLLSGTVQVTKKVSDKNEVNVASHGAGTFLGEVPILLDIPYEVTIRTVELSRLLRIKKENFWNILTSCTPITNEILRTMAQRVQLVQSISQEQGKLIALGRLAAGLAHELNNPASAASSSSTQLRELLQTLTTRSMKFAQYSQANKLTNDQLEFINTILQNTREHSANSTTTTTIAKNIPQQQDGHVSLTSTDQLARSDRESEIEAWLDTHNIPDGWKLAPTFIEMGYDIEWFDNIARVIPNQLLQEVLPWLEAVIKTSGMLYEIEHSTARISELVGAIKTYSYMDKARIQNVDVHEGLESTLTILHHKIKHGIEIIREYDPDLPRITVYGSELNQVWTNLIDNAVDALDGHGHIWIRTGTDDGNNHIVVEIADDGPGIPPEVQSRIFEPFLTTKGVGKGTGLGLSISYRIVVEMHKGQITFLSKPGDTRFEVLLPVIQE
jgi:signal transduction histidine kinase